MLANITNDLTSNVPFQPTRPTKTNAQVDSFASSRSRSTSNASGRMRAARAANNGARAGRHPLGHPGPRGQTSRMTTGFPSCGMRPRGQRPTKSLQRRLASGHPIFRSAALHRANFLTLPWIEGISGVHPAAHPPRLSTAIDSHRGASARRARRVDATAPCHAEAIRQT